jgi:hypothetical protein
MAPAQPVSPKAHSSIPAFIFIVAFEPVSSIQLFHKQIAAQEMAKAFSALAKSYFTE